MRRFKDGPEWRLGAALFVPLTLVIASSSARSAPIPLDGAIAGAGWVEAAGGRLSVALREAPLEEVLEAVGQQTGLAVRAQRPLGRRVSDQFTRLPLEAALRRLLRPLNIAFVYAAPGGRAAAARLVEVVVYPAAGSPGAGRGNAGGAGRGATGGQVLVRERVPAAVGQQVARLEAAGGAAAGRELTALLRDPNPAVRQRALEAAEATGVVGAAVLGEVALRDPEQQVRRAAVAALRATAGEAAATVALRGGLTDGHPEVRLAALEALGEQMGGAAGEAAARAALSDPDPLVRAKAAELVAIFEEARLGAASPEREAAEDEAEALSADEPAAAEGEAGGNEPATPPASPGQSG